MTHTRPKSYTQAVLRTFNDYERHIYDSLSIFERRRYTSYLNSCKSFKKKSPPKPPSEWLDYQAYEMDYVAIGEVLGISHNTACGYAFTALKKMRQIIDKNPEKYAILREYLYTR